MNDAKAPGKKWSKKDPKSLRGAIVSWWLFNGMYVRAGVTKADVFAAMPAGECARICVTHFRGFASLLEDRANGHTGYGPTWRHYESKRGLPGWGDVTEIVERFKREERETLEAASSARALADRIELEGLPAELEGFVPEDGRAW